MVNSSSSTTAQISALSKPTPYVYFPDVITVREGRPLTFNIELRNATTQGVGYSYYFYDPYTFSTSPEFSYGGGGGSLSVGGGYTSRPIEIEADADRIAEPTEKKLLVLTLSGTDGVKFQDGSTMKYVQIWVQDNSATVGTTGNDELYGTMALETFRGGLGNDKYHLQAGEKVVELLNQGTDTVYSEGSHTLGANVEHLILEGNLLINGRGNALANNITGNNAKNTLWGGDGNDRIDGAGGDDYIYGENGNDRLIGGWGDNRLDGGAGNDTLISTDGQDTLIGGAGKDWLKGDHHDIFVFQNLSDSKVGAERDVIVFQDDWFTDGTIDLRALDANTKLAGNQAFKTGVAYYDDLATKAAAHSVWMYDGDDFVIIRADVNGDAKQDFEIMVMNTDSMSAWEFLL